MINVLTGLARECTHTEWQKLFTATVDSCLLTRDFCLNKFKRDGKTCPVADAIAICKRFLEANVCIG